MHRVADWNLEQRRYCVRSGGCAGCVYNVDACWGVGFYPHRPVHLATPLSPQTVLSRVVEPFQRDKGKLSKPSPMSVGRTRGGGGGGWRGGGCRLGGAKRITPTVSDAQQHTGKHSNLSASGVAGCLSKLLFQVDRCNHPVFLVTPTSPLPHTKTLRGHGNGHRQ